MVPANSPGNAVAYRLWTEAIVLVILHAHDRVDAPGLQHLDGDGRHDARPLYAGQDASAYCDVGWLTGAAAIGPSLSDNCAPAGDHT